MPPGRSVNIRSANFFGKGGSKKSSKRSSRGGRK